MITHYQQIDTAFAVLSDDDFLLSEPIVMDSRSKLNKADSIFVKDQSPCLKTSPAITVVESNNGERNSSFLRSILATIFLLLALLCGYYALPNTKGVAVPSGTTQIEKRYVTKNIEDIQVGDEVYAFDIENGKTVKRRVTNVLQRTNDHLRYLTVHDSTETQIFETTDSHPFWVVTDTPDLRRAAEENVIDNGTWLHHENVDVTEHGYYVEAGKLRVGDIFISPHGKRSTLEKTERTEYPNGITVYNFEVEDNHNYFVIANPEAFQKGAEPVLVHNTNQCLHGNSKDSLKPATLYAKVDKDGNFLKWGISQNPPTRYSKSQLEGGKLNDNYVHGTGTRSDILDRERKLVERFPGPENHEPWAGRKKSEHLNYDPSK
jgi:hypothetical protein